MKTFLKVLNYFFTVLGVIFFFILIFALYFFITDPFNLRPLFSSLSISPSEVMEVVGGVKNDAGAVVNDGSTSSNPLLNAEQEKVLKSIGIDPETLPTEVTPELEDCLVEKVGKKRAEEIAKGSEPTALDILKASSCLK